MNFDMLKTPVSILLMVNIKTELCLCLFPVKHNFNNFFLF